ncbi:MAG TPA: hypothetical protein VN603_11335 [Candidatus Acidoferrales bacterium]|nr:hypothetical protein [Candidatus Acidoferrales bacterium]
MSGDASAFVAEIDGRISGYVQEIRDRAAAVKADLESGVSSLRSKAQPGAEAVSAPPAEDGVWESNGAAAEPEGDLTPFEEFAEPTNGSHPLDAPIFGDTDSFLSDDLDFTIDLDDNLPS